MSKRIVAAFGGNALLRGDQQGTAREQEENAYISCKQLVRFLKEGAGLVITHGNGPQVGNILLKNQAGFDTYKIPKMPLDVSVADSQGSIGYMIERQMRNVLAELGLSRKVVTLVTQVLVDEKDPAFQNPTKPIGPYFLKEEADLMARTNGWVFKEDPRKRGWRRVVASPDPLEVFNADLVRELVDAGSVVITCGGGGIPVICMPDGQIDGVEAVIDKDLASSLLAAKIEAHEFYILTDIPKVYVNFQKPDARALDTVVVEEAEKFLQRGEFAAGSMGPKVLACIRFVKQNGGTAIITDTSELGREGAGTKIISSKKVKVESY